MGDTTKCATTKRLAARRCFDNMVFVLIRNPHSQPGDAEHRNQEQACGNEQQVLKANVQNQLVRHRAAGH